MTYRVGAHAMRLTAIALVLASVVASPDNADASTKPSAVVPNISSHRLDFALSKLEKAGIKSSRVKYTARSPQHVFFKKRWRVCAQRPKAGIRLGSGDVLLSVRRVCARAFKTATQREVPYMRQYNHAEDWVTLAKAVCENYEFFTYRSLSKMTAAYIDKEPYEGEVDDVIRIAHRTSCPEIKSKRF